MKSWDIFDTLIGRRCGTAQNLFRQIGEQLGIPNFATMRVKSESALQVVSGHNYTLDQIYEVYRSRKHPLANEARELEWTLEKHNVFPIVESATQVEPNDIYVSDMYLSVSQISEILEIAGVPRNTIYVSCDGKHRGTIWSELLPKHDIEKHIGDNKHSDVQVAKRSGVPSTEWRNSGLNPWEQTIARENEDLAYWMRCHRLQETDQLIVMQSQYNAPLLLACSQVLHDIVQTNWLEHVLFSERDCCLWHDMFRILYPDVRASYIIANRNLLRNGGKKYYRYLNELYQNNAILVDLCASGKSLSFALPHLETQNPQFFTPLLLSGMKANLSGIVAHRITTNIATTCNNTFMEMLNYDTQFRVTRLDDPPIREDENEYDMAVVQEQHNAFHQMLSDMPPKPLVDPGTVATQCMIKIHAQKDLLKKAFPGHFTVEHKRSASLARDERQVQPSRKFNLERRPNMHIVGSIDELNWPKFKHWFMSLKLSGYSGDVHMICYRTPPGAKKQIRLNNITEHAYPNDRPRVVLNDEWQVVVHRFHRLAELCAEFHPDDWVASLDTTDIVFQKNPQEFLTKIPEEKRIIVPSECISFEDQHWAGPNMKDSFPEHWESMRKEILYNAGSIVARASDLSELSRDIFEMCLPKTKARSHDQAAMNILLRNDRYKHRTWFAPASAGWCYCAASTLCAPPNEQVKLTEPLATIENGLCFFGGEPVYLFHHYNRIPSLNTLIRREIDKRWRHR